MGTSRSTIKTFKWVILCLLALFVALAIPGSLSAENPRPIYGCEIDKCSSSLLLTDSNKLIQDVNISFTIDNLSSSTPTGENLFGQVVIAQLQGTNYLRIPMRNGMSPYFQIALASLNHGDRIEVKINKSQSFSISENGQLLYTHRYQVPVFYFSNSSVKAIGLNLSFTDYSFTLKAYENSWKSRNSATFLFLFCGLFVAYILLQIIKVQPGKDTKEAIRFSIIPLAGLWIFSVYRWLSQHIDLTGVGSPGPFGPVGPLFSDIFQVFQAGAFSKPYLRGATDYPPFAVALGRLSLLIPMTFLVLLFFVLFCFLMGLALRPLLVRATLASRLKLLVVIFFSYPILFGIARGNLDLISIALVLTSVICYSKQSKKIAILTLSIAIALKYWPVVFLLLLIKRRDLKSFALVIFFASTLTLVSTVVLGYTNLPSIIAVIFKPLLDYGASAESLTSYTYSYSINTLVLFVAIILMSANPLNPSVMESHHASMLVHGFTHFFVLFISFCILTILYKKMTKTSSIFLLAGAASLLFTSTSAVYRAGILVVCLVVRMRENEDDVWRYRKKEKNSKSSNRLAQGLRLIEILSWLIVLTPTDFYYQKGTLFSTESILQPIAVIGLLTVEYFFSIQKADVRMRAKT